MCNFESDVATYLTIDGKVFIAPQFGIKFEMKEGGSCPDFVALDFSCNDVIIVEVTARHDLSSFELHIKERDVRWFNPIKRWLTEQGIITNEWRIRFLGFVREPRLKWIENKFVGVSEVTFKALEEAIFPWSYWEKRKKEGLPGNRRAKPD